MEERNTQRSDFDSPDLVQQLREKIRSQANRLRNLEQYRVLCEQRINELSPGHSFPVKPDDLGTGSNFQASQELVQAKQKIARLEQQLLSQNIKVPLADNYVFPPPTTQLSMAQLQELYSAIYYQHHDLMKEKNAVEESLRAEMLNCEEQRAYIEVLKQTLESNLQELGFSGKNIEEFLYKEPAESHNYNTKKKDNEEAESIKELLKVKIEECEALMQERVKTDKHLKEAAEALQYAEEEVERLEEEKSSLLDYIEEQSRKEKAQQDDIERMRDKYDYMERQVNESLQDLHSEASARKGLEKELENIRVLQEECEKLKGVLKGLEGKNESLQANNATLSGTLKETQDELDNLKFQHENSLKEISSIRRTASISETKNEEVQKSAQRLTETNKELENKVIKAEKDLKIFKERKIKELENEFQLQIENLNTELTELKQELQISKDTEKSLEKQLIDYKKKLKKIAEDSESAQNTSNQSTNDLLALKKSLESSQIEIRQLTFEKDKALSDLQRLEFDLKTEKSSSLLLQEELTAAQSKLSETSKTTKSLSETNREKENKLQNCAFEIENLKKNLQVVLKDLESERSLKVQYYDEILKLKKVQSNLSQSGSVIDHCKKMIEEFSSNFGAVSSASNNYCQIVSSQFKDLIFKANEPENIDLQEWVQTVCEELESIIRRLAEYKQDLAGALQKLQSTQYKLDNLSLDEGALRDRERSLRIQVDQLVSDKEKLQLDRETLTNKLQIVQSELSTLKKELQINNDESQRLRDQLNYTTSETIQWRNTAETDIFAIRAVEEKANLLLKEKKELETLLSKLQSAVPSSDLQRIFLEIMKIHSELEVVNRERLRIENQLLRSESEMRSFSRNHQQEKALQVRKDVENLRGQLGNCDSQIMSYKRRMLALEDEMKDVEKVERRRSVLSFENEKGYIQEFGKEGSLYDGKRRFESVEKAGSMFLGMQGGESVEDRPMLSYFDKLRRARNLVSDLREQE